MAGPARKSVGRYEDKLGLGFSASGTRCWSGRKEGGEKKRKREKEMEGKGGQRILARTIWPGSTPSYSFDCGTCVCISMATGERTCGVNRRKSCGRGLEGMFVSV